MPNVMIRKDNEGKMTLYVAKKDQEDEIASIEFEGDDKWGGLIELTDGTKYFIDPLDTTTKLPITLRARRG